MQKAALELADNKTSDDRSQLLGTPSHLYKMTFITTKIPGESIAIVLDAEATDRPGVWIDMDNDGVLDSGERITNFGNTVQYPLTVSQTITIYGKITSFTCSFNNLKKLDVSENPYLTFLVCNVNNLRNVDLTNNIALKTLVCSNNPLEGLNLTNNRALSYLTCNANSLTELNLSANTVLTDLYCYRNQISRLNLKANKRLKNLYAFDNALSELNLSENAALEYLDCSNNLIRKISLPETNTLKYIICPDNRLQELDVSKNASLISLHCGNNLLTRLNLFANPALTFLACHQNQIKSTPMWDLVNSLPVSVHEYSAYIFEEESGEGNQLPLLLTRAGDYRKIARSKNWSLYKFRFSGGAVLLNP